MTTLTQAQFDTLPVGSIVEYRGGSYVNRYRLTPEGWREEGRGHLYDADNFVRAIELEKLNLIQEGPSRRAPAVPHRPREAVRVPPLGVRPTPEELRQWRSDARVGQNDASADYVEVCRRVEVLIDALEDAERGRAELRRERDEARDALARVAPRSYDFNKGDRRFTSAERAVEYAEMQTAGTGRLHVARKDPGSYPFLTLWLVQEVEDR